MSAFSDIISDGLRAMQAECGITFEWNGATIPAIQGSGVSYDETIYGGMRMVAAPTLTVLSADIEAAAGEGARLSTGDVITISGIDYKVKQVSGIDSSDPSDRIYLEGLEQ